MLRIAALVAMSVAVTAPVSAFDEASRAAIDGLKAGKPVPIGAVKSMMLGAERWCYAQLDSQCGWSETYLSIEGNRANFEISNAWDDARDISYVSQGMLREGRFICEIGFHWLPSVRAYGREDGLEIGGRALAALKLEIEQWNTTTQSTACFDYVYAGSDAAADTITLRQRQWSDGVTDVANDVTVTLHYDAEMASALSWY